MHLRRGVTDADHLNLMGVPIEDWSDDTRMRQTVAAADVETDEANRKDGIRRPVPSVQPVHATGPTLSAYSLHPSYSWPSPVPGRPRGVAEG